MGQSRLGQPKSASEGAERDRTWPAIIPSANGVVRTVTAQKLVVELDRDGGGSRKQTYTLNGKSVYVGTGDRFSGGISFLAGMPNAMADLPAFQRWHYDPILDLQSVNAIDRYAAVKALTHRNDLYALAVPALEALLHNEPEQRVALEAAGSSAAMGSALGQDRIGQVLWGEGRNDFRMEAVLILTELASPFARDELIRVAGDAGFKDNEIRQAAVWGLGKAGLKAYEEIVRFIDHRDENLAAHAIVAFGKDTPEAVIRSLVQALIDGTPRKAAAASEAIRLIGGETTLRILIEAAGAHSDWVIATLGRLPAEDVRRAVAGTDLMPQVSPILLLSEGYNWLANEDRVMDIAFLSKQNL
ncbi:MAG TPA: hypothetical protein VI306_09195 [Pyrinomonadaceae bacterium]